MVMHTSLELKSLLNLVFVMDLRCSLQSESHANHITLLPADLFCDARADPAKGSTTRIAFVAEWYMHFGALCKQEIELTTFLNVRLC